jgi:hypothetical protein
MGLSEVKACGDNERLWNRPGAQAFHPARCTPERGVLEPLDAIRIAAVTARAKRARSLAELKGRASVGESAIIDAGHDGGKLSMLKLSAPGADLEGEHERPIPAHLLTNNALDQSREFVGHLQAGKQRVR